MVAERGHAGPGGRSAVDATRMAWAGVLPALGVAMIGMAVGLAPGQDPVIVWVPLAMLTAVAVVKLYAPLLSEIGERGRGAAVTAAAVRSAPVWLGVVWSLLGPGSWVFRLLVVAATIGLAAAALEFTARRTVVRRRNQRDEYLSVGYRLRWDLCFALPVIGAAAWASDSADVGRVDPGLLGVVLVACIGVLYANVYAAFDSDPFLLPHERSRALAVSALLLLALGLSGRLDSALGALFLGLLLTTFVVVSERLRRRYRRRHLRHRDDAEAPSSDGSRRG